VTSPSTLVVGGGIVGLACAIEAQRRGHSVTLIDRSEPGQGCSMGNAGILAVSEIFPLITAHRVIELPRMLMNRNAPAVVRVRSLPQFLPWMVRAAMTLSQERQRAITDGLVGLNSKAVSAWRDVLDLCDARHLLRENGMIRLIRDERDRKHLIQVRDKLSLRSLSARLIDGHDVRALEPAIGGSVIGGLLHESDADIGDPLDISRALTNRLVTAGGIIRRETAVSLRPRETAAELTTESDVHSADQIIIAMGLHSAKLLKPMRVRVPLQAERGYHLALNGVGNLLSRPVTFQRESCVATPMGATLRLAGTVEFANEFAAPDWSRAQRLFDHTQLYFDDRLPHNDISRWIGSRPSLPDSLPAIGRIQSAPTIGYAFGHQHLGITQAAISARLLCELMNGEPTCVDYRPYDLARF
jgi:D-hydroxyproline dehydrogenase